MARILSGISLGMATGWSLFLLVLLGAVSLPAQNLTVVTQAGKSEVKVNGQPLLEYQRKPNPSKLYISRWYTPEGVQVLRDSPHDHVHHHALMFAIGIDGVDFWSETPLDERGRQVGTADTAYTAYTGDTGDTGDDVGGEPDVAAIEQEVNWIAPDGTVVAEEARQIRACVGVISNASLLTWQSALRPASDHDKIELWGRHYFGLGLRFVESMDEGSEFVMAGGEAGTGVRGSEKLTRSAWCAVQGDAGGNPVTLALFDDPDNPRHPATWFTMTSPFAYLAATLRLHEEPLMVAKGHELTCRYGLALWDGRIEKEKIEAAYRKWLRLH